MSTILKVNDLTAHYGSINALKGVSLEVEKGEIVTVIGANGAGKSTLLKCIVGVMNKSSGTVEFEGNDITRTGSDKIVRMGIAMVPEGRQIFSELSVLENLKMGAYTRSKKEDLTPDYDLVFGIFPKLKERAHQKGGNLSGGEQQMLAVSRALMSRPKLLLIDELSMGLAPVLVESLFDALMDINRKGTTIVLVEQDANMALKFSNRAYVIETGIVAFSGKSADLLEDDRVREIYLGG
ncbi:MAG TPA: ABC transporter ATP-binding protein [Clostridiales bacterium]|jgi:branched-chain amino acid transport system ATP-binding protein|nr:ABC transporter ATP-binding protein [Clostridiales bacterium]